MLFKLGTEGIVKMNLETLAINRSENRLMIQDGHLVVSLNDFQIRDEREFDNALFDILFGEDAAKVIDLTTVFSRAGFVYKAGTGYISPCIDTNHTLIFHANRKAYYVGRIKSIATADLIIYHHENSDRVFAWSLEDDDEYRYIESSYFREQISGTVIESEKGTFFIAEAFSSKQARELVMGNLLLDLGVRVFEPDFFDHAKNLKIVMNEAWI